MDLWWLLLLVPVAMAALCFLGMGRARGCGCMGSKHRARRESIPDAGGVAIRE